MLAAGRAGVFNVGVRSALLGAAERCSSDEDAICSSDECFVACKISAHFVPRGILRVRFPEALSPTRGSKRPPTLKHPLPSPQH